MIHELKTWIAPFQATLDGLKMFEIRKMDRPFAVGDVLHLREWNPFSESYTGRDLYVVVQYIALPATWGLPDGLCVMGIARSAVAITEQFTR